MSKNPNSDRITDEHWAFCEALVALEPSDTEYAGSYTDKPGYHNTRDNLIKQGLTRDYSIVLPQDKLGLGDKTAAVDWTFKSAQRGDSTNIRKYGSRVRDAWKARDPRLTGWREVLIQGDGDDPADGYDFVTWTERTPDNTHRWHGHFSKLRQYTKDAHSYDAMLSILRAQLLEDWLIGPEDDMPYILMKDNKTGRIYACYSSGCVRWLGAGEYKAIVAKIGIGVTVAESADEIARLEAARIDN